MILKFKFFHLKKGNSYYLTNDNKRPRQFEYGNVGERRTLNIELNLIADAALVKISILQK